ncbi:PfkB family carbohydrate kinase [Pendulispora albinea]|uniref:PfkB family carbohydrate kinase n=1 Tax=Pendulispora albinea TaxID=2741071 RepID=A0ABZ2M4M5_9BACT
MISSQSLLIVGSLAFDSLEMPYGTFEYVVGGSTSFASIAGSLLTRGVRIVGVVGEDFPEDYLASLRGRSIDTVGVERVPGKSFFWRGRYSADLNTRETLDTQLNVFANFQPKIPASHRATPYLLLGNIHPQLQIDVLDQMEKPEFIAVDTMNYWISSEPETLAKLLKRTDLLIINDEEARQLSGIQNISRAAQDIRKRGPSHLIIKRGEFGALLFDDAGTFFCPGFPLEEVRDPTGAGDTFAGGLLGYVARHADTSPLTLRRAMFFGSALASFCVEGVGTTRIGEVTRAELDARIQSFVRLVDYGANLTLPVEEESR